MRKSRLRAGDWQVVWRLLVLLILPDFASFAAPLRIECIGDSTTVGYTDNPKWNLQFDFGYRLGLYRRLTAANYQFQFVGESPEPWWGVYGLPRVIGAPDLRDVGQDGHRGYAAFSINMVRTNILNWLSVDNPDLVLLMLGRMDMGSSNVNAAQASLSNLVEMIVTARPTVYVIVADLTPFIIYSQNVIRYNEYISNVLVPSFASRGHRVYGVKLYDRFLVPGGSPTAIDAGLFADAWQHALTEGNERIAQAWFEAITAIFPPTKVIATTNLAGEGTFRIHFSGGAGYTYQIDRAPSMDGPWQVGFTNLTADAQGFFELEDGDTTFATRRFYRVSTSLAGGVTPAAATISPP
jgi:hypothetical protein